MVHLNLSKLRTELSYFWTQCTSLYQLTNSLPICLISCNVFSLFVAANNKSSLREEIPNRDVTYHFTGYTLLIYY